MKRSGLPPVLRRPAAQETYTVQTPQGPRSAPLRHGAYKEFPNHVLLGDDTVHAYAPVIDTAPEMERLVGELGSARG
jgi:hypothetical protein